MRLRNRWLCDIFILKLRRKLQGYKLLGDVSIGIRFKDGIRNTNTPDPWPHDIFSYTRLDNNYIVDCIGFEEYKKWALKDVALPPEAVFLFGPLYREGPKYTESLV